MTTRIVIANEQPYAGSEDPLQSIADTLAFASRDWGAARDSAWLYGIVHGWDQDPGDDPNEGSAMDELAAKWGWDEHQVARLRRLHEAYRALAGGVA